MQAPVSFGLGRLLITPGALERIPELEVRNALARHARRDWGDIRDTDRRANDLAVERGTRIFSVYYSSHGVKFWVVTEANRSATTVLLPEEY